jgi:hypothetical protein
MTSYGQINKNVRKRLSIERASEMVSLMNQGIAQDRYLVFAQNMLEELKKLNQENENLRRLLKSKDQIPLF